MAGTLSFLQGAVFDPVATYAMGEAFDRACHSLREIGKLDGNVEQVLAKRIIELAGDGERDPHKLRERALQALDYSAGVQPAGVQPVPVRLPRP